MGIWTHRLKFSVGTGDVQQLPQTIGNGVHSLLQEVVWDVGDNFPNPVLQLYIRISLLLINQQTYPSKRTYILIQNQQVHVAFLYYMPAGSGESLKKVYCFHFIFGENRP
jgi:hypothetical protein